MSIDTSRDAIVRLLAGLMKEESTMDAIREPGASTLLSNATVDRVRAGLRAAYAVIDAITAERDQSRADLERLKGEVDALKDACLDAGAEREAERTAREQAEARVRELELHLSAHRMIDKHRSSLERLGRGSDDAQS